jgi:hypothetical protein
LTVRALGCGGRGCNVFDRYGANAHVHGRGAVQLGVVDEVGEDPFERVRVDRSAGLAGWNVEGQSVGGVWEGEMPPGDEVADELGHVGGGGYGGAVERSGGKQLVGEVRESVVTNPVFEFDGCFDPNGDNTPTGVDFPSLLAVASTTIEPTAHREAGLQVTCGSGDQGCAGTIPVTSGQQKLGTIRVHLTEESTATLPLPATVPPGAHELTFTVHMTTGAGPQSPVTLPVQGQ